jgi:hypothetical protein
VSGSNSDWRNSSNISFEGNSITFHNPEISNQTNVKTETTNSAKPNRTLFTCFVILLFVFAVTLSLILVNNLVKNSSENITWNESLISDASTRSSQTSNPEELKTATKVVERFCQIESKSEWNSTVKKGTKLKFPIERVIVFEIITNECGEQEACLKFLRQRQLNFTRTYDLGFSIENLPENFLISSDGTIYEGRGFFEGQHTYDRTKTSYNKKSLGIGFAVDSFETVINEKQIKALEFLTRCFTGDLKLDQGFKLFHRTQLGGGNQTRFSEQVKEMSHWRESMHFL